MKNLKFLLMFLSILFFISSCQFNDSGVNFAPEPVVNSEGVDLAALLEVLEEDLSVEDSYTTPVLHVHYCPIAYSDFSAWEGTLLKSFDKLSKIAQVNNKLDGISPLIVNEDARSLISNFRSRIDAELSTEIIELASIHDAVVNAPEGEEPVDLKAYELKLVNANEIAGNLPVKARNIFVSHLAQSFANELEVEAKDKGFFNLRYCRRKEGKPCTRTTVEEIEISLSKGAEGCENAANGIFDLLPSYCAELDSLYDKFVEAGCAVNLDCYDLLGKISEAVSKANTKETCDSARIYIEAYSWGVSRGICSLIYTGKETLNFDIEVNDYFTNCAIEDLR
jgi:hypothetical protein